MTLGAKMVTLYVAASVIIIAVAGAWLAVRFEQQHRAALERQLIGELKHIDFAVTSFMKDVQGDVAALAQNELVRSRDDSEFTSFLDADEASFTYQIGHLEQRIIDIFSAFRATHPYVNSVYMGRENGSFVRSHPRARPTRYDPRTRPWYILAKENPGRVVWTDAYPSVTTPDVNIGVVTALVDDAGTVYGVVGCDVTLASLTEYLSGVQIGEQGHMLLIDQTGTILASREESLRFQAVANLVGDHAQQLLSDTEGSLVFADGDSSAHLFHYTSPYLGWHIATVIPAEEVRQAVWDKLLPELTALLVAMALLSGLTYVGIRLCVIEPLGRLNRVVLTITRSGDLSQRVAIQTSDEIGSLGTSFNQMMQALSDRESALRASEAELSRHRDHLEELVQERTKELAAAITGLTAVNRLGQDLAGIVAPQGLLPTIAQRVANTMAAEVCVVYLVNTETRGLQVAAVHPQSDHQVHAPWSALLDDVVTQAYASGTLQSRADLAASSEAYPKGQVRSVLASPLMSPASGGLGVICVGSLRPGAFGPAQQQLLETMSYQIAVAIENGQLFSATERYAAQLAALHEVGKEIASSLDLDERLQTIANDAVRLLGADRSLILLVDAAEESLTKAVGHGYSQAQLDGHTFQEFQEGISGVVLREKAPALSVDIRVDERNRGIALEKAMQSGDRSAAIAPLIVGDEAIGTLTVVNSEHNRVFGPDDLRLITMLAGQAAIAIRNVQLYEAAQQADRLKSAFLASMSHELRTPLNSIIGFTGILLQGLVGPLSEEQTKQLRMVMSSARHLLELINDVLDISKIEADQLEIACEPFDLRQSIEKALQTVTPLAEKKGLRVVASVAPGVGRMRGDRRRVEQVLLNLLNNAIKFTEKGEVRIESRVLDDQVITRVVDTGIGIKPDDIGTLFRPFRQIDIGIARRHEGTGLGLAICKRLVNKMGGEIWVESEWGKGSVFSFSLPMKREWSGE